MISIGWPIGGHITLSMYTYYTSPLFDTLSTSVGPELRALNRARCRRCGRCRSFLVSHWIISICRPIGGQITLSTYISLLFETLSRECGAPSSPAGDGSRSSLLSLPRFPSSFSSSFRREKDAIFSFISCRWRYVCQIRIIFEQKFLHNLIYYI